MHHSEAFMKKTSPMSRACAWSLALMMVVVSGCAVGQPGEGYNNVSGVNNTPNTNNRENNQRPVAAPGMAQSVNVGDVVQLDGSASVDPDGDSLTYAWELSAPEGSQATVDDPTAAKASFTADVPGLYIATLAVSDGLVESAKAAVKITAEEVVITDNNAPTAAAGVDRRVQKGMTVQLDGSASSDPDGDSLTYEWTMFQRPTGSLAQLNNPKTVNPTLVLDAVGEYRISLVVRDGIEASAPATITITATEQPPDNQAPVAVVGPDQNKKTGQLVQLDGAASGDPDSDVITYMWSLMKPGGSSAQLSSSDAIKPVFTPDVEGTYVATLIVSDGRLTSAPATTTVNVVNDNNPPTANAGPDRTVDVGTLVRLNGGSSSDPDGNPLTYQWTLTTPQGSAASLSGTTSATPSFTPDTSGNYIARLVVSDGKATSEDTVVITVSAVNRAPVANAGSDRTVQVGSLVQLNGTSSYDPDGDSITYSWALTKPAGSNASLSSTASATPSFTPDVSGTYRAQLIVRDGVQDSLLDLAIITATGSSVGCLIFSEYIEGSSNNKGLELYNCGGTALDLSRYGICLMQNEGPECDRQIMLPSSTSLAAGAVFTIGHTNAGLDALKPVAVDLSNNTIMVFNGDDRLVLFYDDDMNGSFTDGGVDSVIDAFGERNLGAGGPPPDFALNTTLRRCNFATYSGIGNFDIVSYYTTAPTDDASDFGVPPVAGCP